MSKTLRQRSRPLRHGTTYVVLRLFSGFVNLLPPRLAFGLGEFIGMALGPLSRADTMTMRRNLRMCLSNPPSVRRCWADLGRRFVELLCARRAIESFKLADGAEAVFARAKKTGAGVLVATTHMGNWELMAAALSRMGYPVFAVAGQTPKGPLGKWLMANRRQLGVETTGVGEGARQSLRRLQRGESVAIFVDQATRERSRPIEFMGHTAPTPVTYERLLKLSGAVPILVWNVRSDDGSYTIDAQEVPLGVPALDWLNARISELVTQAPTQWVWLHERWPEKDRT